MCPLYVACVSTGLSLSRQKRPSRMQKKSNVRQKKALKRYLLQKDTTDVSFVLSSSASHYFTTVQKILTTNVRQKKTLQKIVTTFLHYRAAAVFSKALLFFLYFFLHYRAAAVFSKALFLAPDIRRSPPHTQGAKTVSKNLFYIRNYFLRPAYIPPHTRGITKVCSLTQKPFCSHTSTCLVCFLSLGLLECVLLLSSTSKVPV